MSLGYKKRDLSFKSVQMKWLAGQPVHSQHMTFHNAI